MDPIRSLSEYQQLRDGFTWERPTHFNFGYDVIDRCADRQPEQQALFWVGPEAERQVTFADLRDRSNRLASALTASELEQGDRLLVLLPGVIPWWETMIAAFKANIVAMPATTMLTPQDIAYRIEVSQAAGVITDSSGAEKLAQLPTALKSLKTRILVADDARNGWQSYEVAVQTAGELKPIDTLSEAPALIYFTSGTTGPPKMVLHSHASYGTGHRVTADYWQNLSPHDLHWNASDTGWAKAAWSSLFGPWLNGACVFAQHSTGKFAARRVLRFLEDYPITTFCGAPTLYRMLVQENLSEFRPLALRDCMSAGEPLNPEVIATWEQATGLTIRDGYGQTETVFLCGNIPGLKVKPGSMGLPAPGIDLAVIDQQGNRLAVGEEGELAVRVAQERPVGLFREYYRNEAATSKAFQMGWYLTGDRARVDEDGYFWFVGRNDDVITSSAYRIGPFEIEHALLEHPAVVESAAVGKPNSTRGEVVKAFVVLAEGYRGTDELKVELQRHVKQTTAPYKYPREIEFVESLPKTISGKIRRSELRERATADQAHC